MIEWNLSKDWFKANLKNLEKIVNKDYAPPPKKKNSQLGNLPIFRLQNLK